MNFDSSKLIRTELDNESNYVNGISNLHVGNDSPEKILSDHLFAHDFQYSKIFAKEKEQNDDDFFKTFNNLNSISKTKDEENCSQPTHNPGEIHENASLKDESLINKDILNFLESPTLNNSIVN
jgi:hypothetical protein